ncbi:MAG: type II toxin-antitoxin system VapC family toxin [Thiomargarita sp.]|nr:type II toxin-antitoxin system VapC family toxin [Thiomargarita sp.]
MNGMDNFLLDTNAVLDFLKGEDKITTIFNTKLKDKNKFVSEITRMELLGYPDITSEEEETIDQFLSLVEILPCDEIVVKRVIQLRRMTKRLKLPDALIAATAIEYQLILVSRDKVFSLSILGLKLINPDTKIIHTNHVHPPQ